MRTAAMNRNFGSVGGIGNTGLDLGLGGSNIKSIQRGQATIVAANTFMTIALSSFSEAKAVCYINYTGNGTDLDDLCLGAYLSGSNLAIERGGTGVDVTFDWYVVEYNNVKSRQSGGKTISTTSSTQAITSINTTKSILVCSWNTTDANTTYSRTALSYYLTNSTTISFVASVASSKNIYWQVIEFN